MPIDYFLYLLVLSFSFLSRFNAAILPFALGGILMKVCLSLLYFLSCSSSYSFFFTQTGRFFSEMKIKSTIFYRWISLAKLRPFFRYLLSRLLGFFISELMFVRLERIKITMGSYVIFRFSSLQQSHRWVQYQSVVISSVNVQAYGVCRFLTCSNFEVLPHHPNHTRVQPVVLKYVSTTPLPASRENNPFDNKFF